MQYASIDDLPISVKNHLPQHAQEIYRAAFNNAWDEYADASKRHGDESQEEVAHRVAWGAVERDYEKGADGNWHKK